MAIVDYGVGTVAEFDPPLAQLPGKVDVLASDKSLVKAAHRSEVFGPDRHVGRYQIRSAEKGGEVARCCWGSPAFLALDDEPFFGEVTTNGGAFVMGSDDVLEPVRLGFVVAIAEDEAFAERFCRGGVACERRASDAAGVDDSCVE